MSEKFKILIGYDGSDFADAALTGLQRTGLPDEVEAFVATVAEMWIQMPRSYGGVETSYVDETITGEAESREIAQKAVEKLKADFPQWTVNYGTAVGSPAGILLAKADQWKPDLIVVGSQSRGTIGRFFLGSVAQSLVSNALCSVRIIRQTEENEGKANRIIVGVDGSEGANSAVDSIIRRNWIPGSEVRVVSAVSYLIRSNLNQFDLVEPSPITQTDFYQEELRNTEKNVNQAVIRFGNEGLKTSTLIKNEDPRNLLIEEAKEWKADCIFVGANGMSRIERMLVGSVSSTVAARAHCTVEVVR
jgi:nucleotide-binding universal stress UspA family protein